MKEIRNHTTAYDVKRDQAFFGPYRAPHNRHWMYAFVVVTTVLTVLALACANR